MTVSGNGSTWHNTVDMIVGMNGTGTLNITDDGLVSVVGSLTIDSDGDGDSFVRMGTGGMLAVFGQGYTSITNFLALTEGTDAIQYCDGTDWSNISGAVAGTDYRLEYINDGDLNGFTMLTVFAAVPEPSSVVMILVGIGALLVVRRRSIK